MRNVVRHLVEHPYFTGFITLLILVNAVTLGMETDQEIMASIGPQLHAFDTAVLLVFTAELVLKFYAYRLCFLSQAGTGLISEGGKGDGEAEGDGGEGEGDGGGGGGEVEAGRRRQRRGGGRREGDAEGGDGKAEVGESEADGGGCR